MYKNPIFGDIIPQKTINSYSNIIFPKIRNYHPIHD